MCALFVSPAESVIHFCAHVMPKEIDPINKTVVAELSTTFAVAMLVLTALGTGMNSTAIAWFFRGMRLLAVEDSAFDSVLVVVMKVEANFL
jgi:hypothetical protein